MPQNALNEPAAPFELYLQVYLKAFPTIEFRVGFCRGQAPYSDHPSAGAMTFGLKNCRDFRPSARFAIDKDLETRKVSERCPKIGTPMNQACVTS